MIAVEDLEKKLKQNSLDSIYLLYGEEKFLLEMIVKRIKKNFGELINGINYITIDETNIKEIIPDIETPAFGYEKKLIIAKNSGILKKEGKRKNTELAKYREELDDYICKSIDIIKDYVILVFIEDDIDKSNLYKTIEKLGTVCEFQLQNPQQIGKRIKAICNGYKVNIGDDTIRYFIEECGTSMLDLINEIRKLIEYTGEGGTITKEAIDKLSIKNIQAVIFDLTDNLGKKNIKQAMQVLNNLIYSKEPIQKILVTLYNHFKKLYIVKLSENYNKNLAESLKLKPNQMFLTNKYKMQAGYFKEKELRNILKDLTKLDSDYKVGLIDLNIGLETILCNYCS